MSDSNSDFRLVVESTHYTSARVTVSSISAWYSKASPGLGDFMEPVGSSIRSGISQRVNPAVRKIASKFSAKDHARN